MIEANRRICTHGPRRRRTDRPVLLRRTVTLLVLAGLVAWILTGCASHNPSGGYREACGSLPGLLGDDC